jgi:hypothetical protein
MVLGLARKVRLVPPEVICPKVRVRALSQKIKPILFYAIKIDFGEGIEYFYSILNLYSTLLAAWDEFK